VSSDMRSDSWAASVKQTLTRPSEARLAEVAGTLPPRALPRVPRVERETPLPSAARKDSGLRARLQIIDAAAVVGAWVVLGTLFMPATTTVRQWGAQLAAAAVTLVAMQMLGLYRSRLCVRRGQETARIVVAVGAGAVALELLRGDGSQSYGAAVVAAGSCILALMVFRWMFRQWLRAQRVQGRYRRGLVMIGTNDDALGVWTMLHSQPELGYEVRGIVGDSRGYSDWANLPSSPSLDHLPEIARETNACGILLVANAVSASEFHRVIGVGIANGLHVQVWPGFGGLGAHRIRRFPMSGETFLYVEPVKRPAWQLATKRIIDLTGAVVGLLVAAPVLLTAWIAIRLEGGGPALYRQVRVGVNERPFVVYKLRTMALEAETGVDLAVINERTDGPLFKARNDPRVTRVGAVVRALSLDEIPQLFNVLAGTMSLVGPRPALPYEVAQFEPEFLRRHDVKPGITGLWQVEARDNPSFHAYRRLDLVYVDNWSIGLDLFVLMVTVPMVIAHAVSICRRERTPPGVPSKVL
jgi:exopolysaccharide biosynthesis polyprenyl glycosylphosphotransferase